MTLCTAHWWLRRTTMSERGALQAHLMLLALLPSCSSLAACCSKVSMHAVCPAQTAWCSAVAPEAHAIAAGAAPTLWQSLDGAECALLTKVGTARPVVLRLHSPLLSPSHASAPSCSSVGTTSALPAFTAAISGVRPGQGTSTSRQHRTHTQYLHVAMASLLHSVPAIWRRQPLPPPPKLRCSWLVQAMRHQHLDALGFNHTPTNLLVFAR